jgi:hypothetical protein
MSGWGREGHTGHPGIPDDDTGGAARALLVRSHPLYLPRLERKRTPVPPIHLHRPDQKVAGFVSVQRPVGVEERLLRVAAAVVRPALPPPRSPGCSSPLSRRCGNHPCRCHRLESGADGGDRSGSRPPRRQGGGRSRLGRHVLVTIVVGASASAAVIVILVPGTSRRRIGRRARSREKLPGSEAVYAPPCHHMGILLLLQCQPRHMVRGVWGCAPEMKVVPFTITVVEQQCARGVYIALRVGEERLRGGGVGDVRA